MLECMRALLTESEFDVLADQTLNALVEALSDLEDDRLEADLESGVLTVRFDDGVRYVINSHRAALQIWMAAGPTAWHFQWTGQEWRSTKTDEELWRTVSTKIGSKIGYEIAFGAE